MYTNAKKRQEILEVPYKDRESKARQLVGMDWTSATELRNAVSDIDFSFSVLLELGLVKLKGDWVKISPEGVIACEAGQVAR